MTRCEKSSRLIVRRTRDLQFGDKGSKNFGCECYTKVLNTTRTPEDIFRASTFKEEAEFGTGEHRVVHGGREEFKHVVKN